MNVRWCHPSDWVNPFVSPPVGCCNLSSPFITITQPKWWYSFCCHTDGGRLSWPRHSSKGVQPVSQCPLWNLNLGPCTPQSGVLPLDSCNLSARAVGWLEFNVLFQHKYGYIGDENVHASVELVCLSVVQWWRHSGTSAPSAEIRSATSGRCNVRWLHFLFLLFFFTHTS